MSSNSKLTLEQCRNHDVRLSLKLTERFLGSHANLLKVSFSIDGDILIKLRQDSSIEHLEEEVVEKLKEELEPFWKCDYRHWIDYATFETFWAFQK